MAMERSTPNVVMDDNYKMFVNALARRYAERGASVYTNAEAIEQERKTVRTRAIAPDAYRLSKDAGQMTEALYKSGVDGDNKYMTTEDYLSYFGKCHDTFEAIDYYARHKEEKSDHEDLKVAVNAKRLAQLRMAQQKKIKKQVVAAPRMSFSDKVAEFFDSMGKARCRMMAGMTAAAVSMMLFAGGLFLFSPDVPEKTYVEESTPGEDVALVGEQGTYGLAEE